MKFRSIKYFIFEGLKNIWINDFMSLASILTVTASLLIFSLFLIGTMNVNHIMTQVRDEYEILAVINEDATPERTLDIGKEIKADPKVKDALLVTKQEALEQMRKQIDNEDVFAGMDLNNPLRDTYRITLNNLEDSKDVALALGKINDVVKVTTSEDIVNGLLSITKIVNIISFWIYILLMLISVSIITNTIRIAVYARRKEINIMKFIGATNWFIRWPFVVEGMVIGLIAGAITILVMFYAYEYVIKSFMDIFGATNMTFTLQTVGDVIGTLSLSVIVLGVISGVLGSVFSVTRHLKV